MEPINTFLQSTGFAIIAKEPLDLVMILIACILL